MTHSRKRHQGEHGVAVIMTALCLIPLMAFAAFGVDLASWYSRVSYLQKAADAASLAGTVWMPDLDKATGIACDSLKQNGIDGGDCGLGDFGVEIRQGSTSTALRVTVTDPHATRYFSQVITGGDQSLTRSAEAEYNLPIPLGSPLNYFGGDATKTAGDPVTTYSVSWPTDYTTRVPANVSGGCNVGTSSGQDLGRWPNAGGHTGGFDGDDPQCQWTVVGAPSSGTSASPPPDYTTRQPNNTGGSGCRVRRNGNTNPTLGRWQGSNFTTSTGGTGSLPACSWTNFATDPSSIPVFAGVQTPTNRPCRIGYETSGAGGGWWPSSGGFDSTANNPPVGASTGEGNRLCQWTTRVTSTTTTPPNPIDSARSPGFWAAVGGPGDVSAFGDAYSARCTGNTNCADTPNQNHTEDGYWYVIKMPAASASSTTVRVFDASYNVASGPGPAGDTRGSFSSGNGFTTTYRMYRQTHPLDFNQRTAMGPGSPNQTPGSCHWALRDQSAFDIKWEDFCPLPATNGAIYLLNVKTSGTSGNTDGVNGYAVEAVSSGPVQPAVYAFGTMAMRNNIENGEANFYLAEVGEQYAGRTLVIELFDAGDASGNAYLQPVMPQTALDAWTNIPSNRCSYTSSPSPNPGIFSGTPAGGRTSPPVPNATQPALGNCRIQTTVGGTQQFNDSWNQIRVTIPSDYTCTLGKNPEDVAQVAGNCWWGIRYDFSDASANDVTTWRARIEGNPVHLTQ